jgi:hypothetical protein
MDQKPWEECVQRLGGLTPYQGKSFVALSEDELEAIEAEFGMPLPNDYRRFLATYGASTFNCLTSIRAAGPLPKSLSDDGLLPFGTFYGTNREAHDYPSIRFCAEQFTEDIPAGLLTIADAGNDDQICIGLLGKLRGKIFYYDSQSVSENSDGDAEQSDEEASLSSRSIYLVADSFTDFMNRIEPFAG